MRNCENKRPTHQQICGYEHSAGARPELSHDYVSLLLIHVSMLEDTKTLTWTSQYKCHAWLQDLNKYDQLCLKMSP